MFILVKEFTFEAAHQLVHHDGKCRRLHGHSWKGRIVVRGEDLYKSGPKKGMLIDYSDLKSLYQPIVEEYLDHHFLNETLKTDSPTSEFVARWLYNTLVDAVPDFLEEAHDDRDIRLIAVEIDETCTSKCIYS